MSFLLNIILLNATGLRENGISNEDESYSNPPILVSKETVEFDYGSLPASKQTQWNTVEGNGLLNEHLYKDTSEDENYKAQCESKSEYGIYKYQKGSAEEISCSECESEDENYEYQEGSDEEINFSECESEDDDSDCQGYFEKKFNCVQCEDENDYEIKKRLQIKWSILFRKPGSMSIKEEQRLRKTIERQEQEEISIKDFEKQKFLNKNVRRSLIKEFKRQVESNEQRFEFFVPEEEHLHDQFKRIEKFDKKIGREKKLTKKA